MIWRLALDMSQKIEQGKIPDVQAYVRSNVLSRRNSHDQILSPFNPWSYEAVLKRNITDERARYQVLRTKLEASYGNQVLAVKIKECGRMNQEGRVTQISETADESTVQATGQAVCLLASLQSKIETRMTLDYAFSVYQVLALHMLQRIEEFYR